MATQQTKRIPQGATSFYDFSQGDNSTRVMPGTDPNANATTNNDGNTTTTTGTTTTGATVPPPSTATNPYAQFKGNIHEELINFIRSQMDAIKPETKEEREKREKREKWEGVISGISDMGMALSNLFFTTRYAPNMYDGKHSLSAKAKERFEKAKAQRDKNYDRLVNYAIILDNIKNKDREFNFSVTQAEQQQSNWQQQQSNWQQQFDKENEHWDKKFDTDNEHWQKGFDENQRQFDVTAKEHERHNRASEGLERQRIAASQDGKYTEFYSGSGMIKIPNTRLNQRNISYVFSKTPSAGRPTGQTTPVSADQMMDWIGSNIDDPNVQSALRAIGGQTDTNDNTPPSRRSNNDNTPPSRR